jgi:uncharacterized protein YceH (UPF0502 family)
MNRELIVTESANEQVSLKEMPRKQRRVLGVLLEKAFTVPDQYPMTLKSTTTGCNQKNNRDPISSYDEDDVLDTLIQLQERGLVGCLHTESGRTERYRHYMRHKTTLTEQQLAIMTELMLRGKQQLGELRTRASRMVAIDTQEDLRKVLQTLMGLGLVRANGPLERRGIEVDHDLYPHSENHEPLAPFNADEMEGPTTSTPALTPTASRRVFDEASSNHAGQERLASLEATVRALRDELASVRSDFVALQDRFEDLRRQLGG